MTFAYYNEIDPFCVRVLRKQILAGHLPAGVVDDRDIRDVQPDDLRGFQQVHLFAGIGGIPLGFRWAGMPDDFEVWTGGFPCQDISQAGRGAGINGTRSGLWSEYIRLVRVLRPRYVIVENVAALRSRGLGVVLGDLAACGYDAEWDCIPAAAVGAPHIRDRLFVVAYAAGERWEARGQRPSGQTLVVAGSAAVADANGLRQPQPQGRLGEQRRRACDGGEALPDADRAGCAQQWRASTAAPGYATAERGGWWEPEPSVGGTPDGFSARVDRTGLTGPLLNVWAGDWEQGVPRVAHGIPGRVDRLRGLGNAVVPHVAECVARVLIGMG